MVAIITDLGKRKHGSEINNKIRLQVMKGNSSGLHNKLTPPNNPSTRLNKRSAKFQDNVHQISEISRCAENHNSDQQPSLSLYATGVFDIREIEIKGVNEQSRQTNTKKHPVP